jgi:hypothetical protein
MEKAARKPPQSGGPPKRSRSGYAWLSMRPLHVLLFLLPLVVLYELGSIRYLSDRAHGVVEMIGAQRILGNFLEIFGAAGLHVPALLLIAVLLAWHVLERDPWRPKPAVVMGMALESALWTLPVLVFGLIIGLDHPAAAVEGQDLARRSWQARLTLSLGAGIYEELLFRLILVTAIHFVLVDLVKLSQGVGYVVAAVVSALSFALYHDLTVRGGGADLWKFLFLGGAGIYFSALFIMRGFGVAAGTHAIYDAVVLIAVAGVGRGGG